jgi:hypothetical protein
MRPQQQGRRSRNRGSGRRNQNPLQRSYESNGPDVKIRGNAQVIADKYATLARDALSSGDTVMAENYLQHAEHYNRIILAAQPQPREDDDEQGDNQQQATGDDGQQQQGRRNRNRRDRDDRNPDADDAQPAAATADAGESPADVAAQPQPVIDGTPAEVRQEEAQHAADAEEPAKPKRPRKPRKKPVEAEAAAEGTADGEEAPVAAE